MTEDQQIREVGVKLADALKDVYGEGRRMAAVVVVYLEDTQRVQVASNVEEKTSIAIMCDGIKIFNNLPQPS